ncbi:hypothetical protein D5086_002419 [Populus alba]|uniref:Uncharacterized protein n=2 Tax=Populus TaxID=3689 RepID=A0ACC4D225_POPAL|nr:hypothetical protein NC653_002899 [Populus alba x Populus x berolinensis]
MGPKETIHMGLSLGQSKRSRESKPLFSTPTSTNSVVVFTSVCKQSGKSTGGHRKRGNLGHASLTEKKQSGRKETVLDLAKFVDKGVQVKLTGGRQVTGTLKGYDQLLNLVLDEAVEFLRDADDPLKTTDQTRRLGLIVCRGTAVMLVSPTDGTDEIANPFVQPDGA